MEPGVSFLAAVDSLDSGMNQFRLVIYEFLFPEIPLCDGRQRTIG